MEQGIRTVILLWLLFSTILYSHAQDYSTWGEIYDYEVGDIFHYNEWASGSGGGYDESTNIEIVEKTFSQDSNTVTYIEFVKRLYFDPGTPLHGEYSEYTDTISYDNLNSIFIADTIYTSSAYNGRKISYQNLSVPIWTEEYRRYVDGCGFAFWYRDDKQLPAYVFERKLKYYKKGDEEWGTPIILVDIDERKKVFEGVKTYPNPFTTSTTIEYELKEISNMQFTIYNVIGEVVYNAEDHIRPPGSHTVTWSPSHLPEGLYYGVLRSEEGVSVVKIIKQ